MRDGIRLSADVYRPDQEGKYPVLLLRTYYGKCNRDLGDADLKEFIYYFVTRGYVVVVQDCRGRYDSEGEFYIEIYDFDDGYDTIEWCGTQEWSNGKVGMFGCSYAGCVQFSAAITANPHLKCIVPHDATSDSYFNGGFMRGGVVEEWFTWAVKNTGRTSRPSLFKEINWQKLWRNLPLPLINLDEHLGFQIPYWKDYFRHPTYDEYWDRFSYERKHDQVSVPSLNIGGWSSDKDIDGTIKNYMGVVEKGQSIPTGTHHKLLIGPWPHCNIVDSRGEITFGNEALLDLKEVHLRWFDYWLKGKETGIMQEPPVKYFLLGANEWRTADKWPPKSVLSDFYLHSTGKANSLLGDGILSRTSPETEPIDQFINDPNYPVPFPLSPGEDPSSEPILDQRVVERRDDVLVYSTPPLDASMTVVGPIVAKIYAATSAKDTDFVAKLIDVYPNEMAIYLTIGVVRGRFRTSFDKETLLEPNKIYEYDINLWWTANLFKKGHQIRLELTSSAFPRFLKNQNTGNNIGTDVESVIAHQRIYHNHEYPSRLILPIVNYSPLS